MEMKEGVTVVVQLTNRSRGEGKAGFCGFIYLPLIKQLWQRPGSDKGRGQVWFSAQLLACQPITAAGLKAAHCLSASRTSQHREGEPTDTEHWKLLIREELGWLHRIVTYKRVMSLVLMYVNQEKLMSSTIQLLSSNNILYNHFSGEDNFLLFLLQTANHLPDPACENSFRLNVTNLILRPNDDNINNKWTTVQSNLHRRED